MGLLGIRAMSIVAALGSVVVAACAQDAPAFQSFSKFDFVPGEKIIAMEDFTQDAIGDFPAKWNTNASGEIVTLAGQTGRWLKLTKAGFFTPDFITELPENVTVEFDLFVRPDFEAGFPLEFALAQIADRKRVEDWAEGANVITVTAFPASSQGQGSSVVTSRQDSVSGSANTAQPAQLTAGSKPIHIAMWRQRQRARVYFNEEKVWDLPRAVSVSAKFNSLIFFVPGGCGN